MKSEMERLKLALAAHRTKMADMSAGSMPLRMYLDEAHLMGQIQSLEFAIGTDDGGWPHDAWFPFLDARADAIKSLRLAGKSWRDVLATLNLSETQAQMIYVFGDEAKTPS